MGGRSTRRPGDRAAVRADRLAMVVLLGGIAAAVLASLVGDPAQVQPALTAAGLATGLAVLAGVNLHRPERRLGWRLIALCVSTVGVGEALLTRPGSLGIVGQLVTSAGSLAGFFGLASLLGPRLRGRTRSWAIDAAIIAAGIGAAAWAIGLGPLFVSSHQSTVAAIAFLYPALLAVVIIARMWAEPGEGRIATRLLFLVVCATLAIIGLDLGKGLIDRATFTPLVIFADFSQLTLIATLALHPAMAAPTAVPSLPAGRLSRREIAGLLGALLMNPLALLVDVGLTHAVDVARYVVGGVLLAVLVMARMLDALARLDQSLARQDALATLLAEQALNDQLTSLPNRRAFDSIVKQAFDGRSPSHPTAVLLLDLDDFKEINDTYGHEVGDAVLAGVGRRLADSLRSGDTAARLGGDEFVVVLRDCATPEAALAAARRTQAALGEPLPAAGMMHSVRMSAGVAIASDEDRDVQDLIRRADMAMYRAKRADRGEIVIYPPDRPGAGDGSDGRERSDGPRASEGPSGVGGADATDRAPARDDDLI